ncbi:hypothetical protein RIF29_23214 [Crotalaria pallida]|uniref:Uncharacterized protein n=1 Tax=Crotalaria pallida TaxID=3830 RepID=A0AAN9IEZ0_CROPI
MQAHDPVSAAYELLPDKHSWYTWLAPHLNQFPFNLLPICQFIKLINRRERDISHLLKKKKKKMEYKRKLEAEKKKGEVSHISVKLKRNMPKNWLH